MTHAQVEHITPESYGSEGSVIFPGSTVHVTAGQIRVGHQIIEPESATTHARALLSAVDFIKDWAE